MALVKTTRISGTVNLLSGQEIYVDFMLPEEGQPVNISFSVQVEDINLNGNYHDTSINNYSVNNGKIEVDLLNEIEDKLDEIKLEYLV